MTSANITLIGTGSWGTTLAVLWARLGLNVTLWARTPDEAAALNARRENVTFLPGIPFPLTLRVTHDLAAATGDAHLILLVVPSQTFRANVARLRALVRPAQIVISAAKGIELETLQRMSEIMRAEWPHMPAERLCVLSGPNIAREIAAGLPASTVIAAQDEAVAREAQTHLLTPTFRIYTHSDIVGVELAGALKNVMAIAAGVADGFNVGENAKATLLTRALAEMSRLGVACGANPMTFAGLAGIGDLICTCNSRHSRNHTVGEKLAQGQPLGEILASMKMVAEGVTTTKAARQLAVRCGVEMPLVEQVYAVLFEGKSPRQAIGDLMGRGAKSEFYGISSP
jgi:glycerol-3-phosphate dehydrogenase (NAD(P)+)